MANSEIAIVGSYSPKMSPGISDELNGWVDLIQNSGATHVWVGLGTPKQDYAVHELAKRIDATFFAVGAAFDFLAGTVKEAPPILCNSGFEWVYRLTREPKRLWRRYLVGNLKFLLICLLEVLKFRRNPR
jgi:N-acetylglucosaminyldiphosphoundecaprenol N-acetyl-beta-D-mannosaminyltransferase